MAEITLQESPRLKHLRAPELNKQFKKGNICSSSGREDIFDFRIALERKLIDHHSAEYSSSQDMWWGVVLASWRGKGGAR